jgi:hypothetical protein
VRWSVQQLAKRTVNKWLRVHIPVGECGLSCNFSPRAHHFSARKRLRVRFHSAAVDGLGTDSSVKEVLLVPVTSHVTIRNQRLIIQQ